MKIRNAILFLFVTVLTFSSCKESEDNPVITMNPTTEKILAEGLNIGAYGKDTTVLFPKADGYDIDISYAAGSGKWCRASEIPETDNYRAGSDNDQTAVRIVCAQSDDSLLIAREAKITLSSSDNKYVIKVKQRPHQLAYFKDKVLYIPNTGGDFKMSVLANTKFEVYANSGKWLTKNSDPIKCTEAKAVEVPFYVSLNTGLGRSDFYRILGNYYDYINPAPGYVYDDKGPTIMIIQEPRTLHEAETVDVDKPEFHVGGLETMLGHDKENLSRLKKLTVINRVTPSDMGYLAKISALNIDTLNMAECIYDADEYEKYISQRMFFGCHLSCIVLPKGTERIYNEAFANCANLKMVSLPSSVKNIGIMAFASSPRIEKILIPSDSKLDYIMDEAFNTGGTMTSLFIPATADLTKNALKGLRVKELHIRLATPPTLNPDDDVDRSASVLYVPVGSKGKYVSATYFKDFGKIVEE